MINLTANEKKALLVLFKEPNQHYNANSISKHIGITRVGALKMFRKFHKASIVTSEHIGKSITYKLNLHDDYVQKLISFLLADEATQYMRWKEEFKELFKEGKIVILFGSAIKNYEVARDIDIMIILKEGSEKAVNKILKEKDVILPKKLHAIKLTPQEFINNIKAKNKAIVDITKNSIILHGQDEYVELIKNVTGS